MTPIQTLDRFHEAAKAARDLVPYLYALDASLQEQKIQLITLLDSVLCKGVPLFPETPDELKAAVFSLLETGHINKSCLRSFEAFRGAIWTYLETEYPDARIRHWCNLLTDCKAWYNELYYSDKQKRLAAIYGPDVEHNMNVVEWELPSGSRIWAQCTDDDLAESVKSLRDMGWRVFINGIGR